MPYGGAVPTTGWYRPQHDTPQQTAGQESEGYRLWHQAHSGNTGGSRSGGNGSVDRVFDAPELGGPDFGAMEGAQMQAARAAAAGAFARYGDEAFRTGGAGGAARRSFMGAYGATMGERSALEAQRDIAGMKESQAEFQSAAQQRADALNLQKYQGDQNNWAAIVAQLLSMSGGGAGGGPIDEAGGGGSPAFGWDPGSGSFNPGGGAFTGSGFRPTRRYF